jgi:DNA-binding IclR family transcriptional regulator
MNGMKRGLDVLDVVAERGPMTVDAIADAVALPLSTTYRYVRTLSTLGYLRGSAGQYDVGIAMLGLLRRADTTAALSRHALPLLVELTLRVEEAVLLTVPVGWTAKCVASVEPRRPVRLSDRRGIALPLHAGASARPLLAHLPGRVVEEYLRFIGSAAGGRDPVELRRQLAEIRRTGVCVTVGELDDGIGIGVPVFTDREVAACLSVAGHRTRFPGPRIREAVTLLRHTADAVERTWSGASPAALAATDG